MNTSELMDLFYLSCCGPLLTYSTEASRLSLAYSFGMVGVVVGAGASLYLSASAASTVATAEAELERQRQKARELDHVLQNVAVDLELFKHEKAGLVWRRLFCQSCCF